MFTLNIKTDNAAFQGYEEDAPGELRACQMEVARILRAVADQIEELSWRGTLFDINGNSVGTYKLED